jgi:hypothetical protein
MNLFYCIRTAYEKYGINKHPQIVINDLGITYAEAIPQSIADGWEFIGCVNVPEVLPKYLRVI